MTITAQIIADSTSPQHIRLTTLQLRYPKFIHGEFMTHRVFSRNASSSRAIPGERLIRDVLDDPAMPSFWGKNQPGMQAREECDERVKSWEFDLPEGRSWSREECWLDLRDEAVKRARAFAEAGYHKQIVNRLLEPWVHINVVVSATQWSNFFALRLHEDAQPEIQELAKAMASALQNSIPTALQHGEWHLPYVQKPDREEAARLSWGSEAYFRELVQLSVARCARVSYLTQEGQPPTREADLALFKRLVSSVPLHASPAEHQATPDFFNALKEHWAKPALHGNFHGWVQFRKTLSSEAQ